MEPKTEEFRVYIVRRQHLDEWRAKMDGGDEIAKTCLWAIKNFLDEMPTEHSVCSCCDMVFPPRRVPRAFIVLIPAEYDPQTVKARAAAVCRECSKQEDKWLVDQGIRREDGLPPTGLRPGDRVH